MKRRDFIAASTTILGLSTGFGKPVKTARAVKSGNPPIYPDVSILMGMTDREIRDVIKRGGPKGQAVLSAMIREREGTAPALIGGFRYVNTTQLTGEILVCQRQSAEHKMVMDGSWGGCLAQMPNGKILLLDSSKRMCWSADDGRTWSEPTTLGSPVSDWGVTGAVGALRDGTILVSGMSKGLPSTLPDPNKLGPPVEGYVSRSTDDGRSWEKPYHLDRLGYHILEPASHLRFLELQNGTILLGVTGNPARTLDKFYYSDGTEVPPPGNLVRADWRDHDQWIFRSNDGGRTWGKPTLLAEWGSETNFVQLPSGKIVATIRYQREWAVEDDDARVIRASTDPNEPSYCSVFIDTFISESTDNGLTWSEPRKASRYLEHPSDIVCLSDGTLVMIMGHKSFPQGPHAVWSRDEGRTWSQHFIALHMDPKGAAGQPSALVLEDDTILVSYDRNTWDVKSTTNPPKTKYQLWVMRFKLPHNLT